MTNPADDLRLLDVTALARENPPKLSDRFGFVPLSVFRADLPEWKERKRRWLSLGIESEVGRDKNLLGMSKTVLAQMGDEGTSIFDPVICEAMYRWYCPPGGLVLDPFAGGSVRGIVAAALGREYIGIELREEQCEANREQVEEIRFWPEEQDPMWVCGDSLGELDKAGVGPDPLRADFVFSCPPYYDLEVYSSDQRDLSALPSYARFKAAYAEIIHKACALLKPDRFACFVVGDARGKRDGCLYGIPGDTVQAFQMAGLRLANDAILSTGAGSAAMRISGQFAAGRALGKTHQYVLIFVKGDRRKAAAACPLEE